MAASRQAAFDQLVAKGRFHHAEILRSIQTKGNKYIKLPEIAPHYTTTLDPPQMPGIDDRFPLNFREVGHPENGYVLAQVKNPGMDDSTPPYQNLVHKDGRIVLCMYNYAANDVNFGTPARMYWPDLMAVSISRVMASTGGNAKSLEAIWRIAIDNQDTNRIIGEAMEKHRIPEDGFVDIPAGEDEFFALLATDNGKGSARMLATYPQMFGKKTISRVRVFKKRLCWFLEEVEIPEPSVAVPEGPSTPSRKERLRLKRLSLASDRSTTDRAL